MQGCFRVFNIDDTEKFMNLNKILGYKPRPDETFEIKNVVYRSESININGEDLKSKNVILYIVYNEFDNSVSVWFHYPTISRGLPLSELNKAD